MNRYGDIAAGSTRKCILVVGNFLSRYGGSRGVCEDLAERLADAGWKVLTASRKRARILMLLDMVLTAWHRRAEYDVAQIDVFSGNAFVWAEAVCWALRRAHKPYVLTLHGGNLPHFVQRHPHRVKRLLQSAAAVTAPSRYLQEQMAPYRGETVLLPNPLELGQYRFVARRRPASKLVWLRAFHTIYNPVLAVNVLARLARSHPAIALIMVGPDKDDGSLQAVQDAARFLGVSDRLTIQAGVPRADVPKWLQKGDIFLNTTNVDNAPVSVLEAQACGLCVVSTNVGGLPYLLDQEQDALLVPPQDPAAMALAVERILTEPRLAERLSRSARAKAEQHDWSVILPQWEELLNKVARRG